MVQFLELMMQLLESTGYVQESIEQVLEFMVQILESIG